MPSIIDSTLSGSIPMANIMLSRVILPWRARNR
jgi:hypothetical protein